MVSGEGKVVFVVDYFAKSFFRYHNQDLSRLAMQLTKYRQREGWTHRDIFRLAHPDPRENVHRNEHELEVEQLYRYAVKGPF